MAAKKAVEIVHNALDSAKVRDIKGDTDTIRLWEGYRDQAMLWRSLSLLQIPATLACAVLAIVLYLNQSITLEVPAKPLPGIYSVDEIPDAEFIDNATSFINLIATYQPAVARRQFSKAREMIGEPMLSRFDEEMMGAELKAIENTRRTQLFMVDPSRTEVTREGSKVFIKLVGDRLKIVAGKELPSSITQYFITTSTIPRNELNPFGLTITNVEVENIER